VKSPSPEGPGDPALDSLYQPQHYANRTGRAGIRRRLAVELKGKAVYDVDLTSNEERHTHVVQVLPAALFSRLDRDTFAAGIENMTDLHNDVREHPHKIDGYLHDAEVARRIADALGLG
jgi:hypothetical protein